MIHKSADIDKTATIGKGCIIWENVKIRENVIIGKNCKIGRNVYIDKNVELGDNCKIQNNVLIYDGVRIGNNVFIGPAVCFTNDKFPRANDDYFSPTPTTVFDGASIGANSTIVCGVLIKENAMIGAGSVVTHSVPKNALAFGNPSRIIMFDMNDKWKRVE